MWFYRLGRVHSFVSHAKIVTSFLNSGQKVHIQFYIFQLVFAVKNQFRGENRKKIHWGILSRTEAEIRYGVNFVSYWRTSWKQENVS